MTRLLIIFLFLLAGLILGPVLQNQQGYVFIEAGPYEMSCSFSVFIVLQILLFCSIYFLIALLKRVIGIFTQSGGWFAKKTRNKSMKKTDLAQHKILEGDYRQAEKLLANHAKSSKYPAIHLLQAAEAAQLNGDPLKANQLLQEAASLCEEKDKFTFEIVRTRIQIENKEAHAAKESIERLLKMKPRHLEVLRLAEKAYLLNGDYQELIDLLPVMYKMHIHSDSELDELKQTIYLRQIRKVGQSGRHALRRWWDSRPKIIRANTVYQRETIQCLIYLGDHEYAQDILMLGLKKQFDPQLIMLAPQIESLQPEKLEKTIKKLLKSSLTQSAINQALIFRVLAQLALKTNNKDDTQHYIEKAIELDAKKEDYALLDKITSKPNTLILENNKDDEKVT